MMPTMFPYNGWDLTHSHHHAHANNLDKDHLWKPLEKKDMKKVSGLKKYVLYYMYGPLFFESSILHQAYHFILPFGMVFWVLLILVTKRKRPEVTRSIIFALIGGVVTIYYAHLSGSILLYYVLPFLGFQFWLSTFTYFHHRLPSQSILVFVC